ncbi:hypothetical protein [Pseudodesulfovibrio sp.]|uniref:hypothetical protein n=1 Tax=Pseudodesulfovibrio sp. TaxID=2035812 RepID=UPI002633A9A5|nr:hypothetical protein [Pseudodesulfovibrio sp.]MDD3311522.1 hypothetical protein [Pseudodesulfovibrio sp.]
MLFGDAGGDTLSGGAGSDIFTYGASDEGGDAIADFSHADDAFHFTYSEFGQSAVGALNADHFFEAASQMNVHEACFYFESDALWYDADGADAQAAVQIAQVTGDAVQADDIVFV